MWTVRYIKGVFRSIEQVSFIEIQGHQKENQGPQCPYNKNYRVFQKILKQRLQKTNIIDILREQKRWFLRQNSFKQATKDKYNETKKEKAQMVGKIVEICIHKFKKQSYTMQNELNKEQRISNKSIDSIINHMFLMNYYNPYNFYLNINITMLRLITLLLLLSLSLTQYTVVNQDIGSTYVKLSLKYTGQSEYYVKPKSKVVKDLIFYFRALTFNDFSFKIYDPNENRYQIPQGGIFPTDAKTNFSFPLSIASYKINFTVNHFSFMIVRKATDAILFDSSIVEMEFSEYYIQFGTVLDSKTLFGYSERFAPHFKLTAGTWTLFNADRPQKIDQGIALKGWQTYGYYPAYMARQRSGLHHMGHFRTSNALDIQIQSFSQNSFMQIFRTIGGIIQFRFMVGNQNPQALLTQFHSYIGNSLIPPFWSLGFHQCRWGYKDISALETVIAKYKQNSIPLDTIWSDIDYMHDFETFTVDTQLFPLDRLRNITIDHQYIVIVEPSIRMLGYAYEQGKRKNMFVKGADGQDLIGKVWAGNVTFPDYFNPNATQYWKDMMQFLYNQVPFSGIWLDMNQVTNLCDGLCYPPQQEAIIDYTQDIPYTPGGGSIQQSTISLNSTHFGKILQANVHPFFGLMQTFNTYEFLRTIRKPFIITRSTTFGSNRFGFHWTGDNYANFTFLKNSIASNFMFGMWGIQMVGSDICGFGGNATVEVCSRFFQLGSLYPFARNHNEFDAIDQQPYALGPIVLESSKKNLLLRYSLLKFYFRQFIIRKGLGTIFRPLYFQFYDDENVLSDNILQTQFLIGRSIMSAPIVQQGKKQRTAYFPRDNWYNFHNGEFHPANSLGIIENDLTDLVPLFIRDGHLVFKQNVDNVTKSRQLDNRFILVGGFKLNKTNSSTITYRAEGGLLSALDYNNEADIEKCISQNCEYVITVILNINKLSRERLIVVDYSFNGRSVKNIQYITDMLIYTQDEVIRYTPLSPIEIFGDGSKTFSFK